MVILLRIFSNFMLEQGMMNAHGCVGGVVFFFNIQY